MEEDLAGRKAQEEGGARPPTIRLKLYGTMVEVNLHEYYLIDLQQELRVDQETNHEQYGPSNSLERWRTKPVEEELLRETIENP